MFFVFNSIVLSVTGLIILIALRDFVQNYFFLKARINRSFKKISNLIVFNKWNDAKRELEFLVEKKGNTKEIILLQSQVLRGTSEGDKALSLISEALVSQPEELLYHLEKAKILLALGNRTIDPKYFATTVVSHTISEKPDVPTPFAGLAKKVDKSACTEAACKEVVCLLVDWQWRSYQAKTGPDLFLDTKDDFLNYCLGVGDILKSPYFIQAQKIIATIAHTLNPNKEHWLAHKFSSYHPALFYHFFIPFKKLGFNVDNLKDVNHPFKEHPNLEKAFISALVKCAFREWGVQGTSINPVYTHGLTEETLDKLIAEH